ncbi:DUF4362 domain-containing protein [Halobacillus litoralis]|uniref:DUF4362 domain-containing protein n=1 Tax=Halobacillus litoralis TaxID=45668 RepID=A0A410MCZ2_9BACI|nr:DUF4362 domain-containing protein [Halobacillus litoralis]QAS52589.1 hypothetical protein HLI_10345 [Halobacillus litoralis]
MRWLLFLFLAVLAGCASNSPEKVVETDAVPDRHEEVTNVDKLDAFMDDVEKGVSSEVRVVQRTTEGAPLYTTLNYDGNNISYERDTRRDRYAAGEITNRTCESIRKEKDTYLMNCGFDRAVEVYRETAEKD